MKCITSKMLPSLPAYSSPPLRAARRYIHKYLQLHGHLHTRTRTHAPLLDDLRCISTTATSQSDLKCSPLNDAEIDIEYSTTHSDSLISTRHASHKTTHVLHCTSLPDSSPAPKANTFTWRRNMRVLGIESSCDDTAASVVTGEGLVLSDTRHSQQKEMLEKYGGVYPKEAAVGHLKHIEGVVQSALSEAECRIDDIDLVAVTSGPGLAPCLAVGLTKAKELARIHNKPLMCINHLEAHALTSRLIDPNLQFPFLVLLVSGGNCQLVLAKGVDRYYRLGKTLDDAPGEALDKTARVLDIETDDCKGGLAVEQAAKRAELRGLPKVLFKEPMVRHRNCNFSFAGLKSALRRKKKLYADTLCEDDLNETKREREIRTREYHDTLAAGFQDAVLDHVVRRTARALVYTKHKMGINVTSLVMSGGVAANSELRKRISGVLDTKGVALVCPPVNMCTDNAVMIAWTAVERCKAGLEVEWDSDAAQLIRFHPDWPLGDDISNDVANARLKAW